jgi:hypothetical protein
VAPGIEQAAAAAYVCGRKAEEAVLVPPTGTTIPAPDGGMSDAGKPQGMWDVVE